MQMQLSAHKSHRATDKFTYGIMKICNVFLDEHVFQSAITQCSETQQKALEGYQKDEE